MGLDWYGKLGADGVLTDVAFREANHPDDVKLGERPPSVKTGVRFRLDPKTKKCVPFRPVVDDGPERLIGALAVMNQTGWAKLPAAVKRQYQAIIDAAAEIEMARPEKPERPEDSVEDLLHKYDPDPISGATPTIG